LSALGARSGTKRQAGKSGARRSVGAPYAVAGAVGVAAARGRAGCWLERGFAALAIDHPVSDPRMGGAGNRGWAPLAVVRGRLWCRHRRLYFTAEREPSLWAVATLAAVCGFAVLLSRKRFVAHLVALGVFAASLGFAVATLRTSLIDHPVLRFSASGVTIAGFVELREESQHTDRFVLRVDRIEGGRMDVKPERVRLSVKRGMAPPPGSYVEVKALLDPPLQPLEPGSYDFARDLFFQGIGASGFARGAIKVIASSSAEGPLQRADAFVQRMRDAIDARIRAVLSGDRGAIAAMLIDGRRDTIATNVMTLCLFRASGTCCRFPAITWP
jgi:predicted membrane metal-binding protein